MKVVNIVALSTKKVKSPRLKNIKFFASIDKMEFREQHLNILTLSRLYKILDLDFILPLNNMKPKGGMDNRDRWFSILPEGVPFKKSDLYQSFTLKNLTCNYLSHIKDKSVGARVWNNAYNIKECTSPFSWNEIKKQRLFVNFTSQLVNGLILCVIKYLSIKFTTFDYKKNYLKSIGPKHIEHWIKLKIPGSYKHKEQDIIDYAVNLFNNLCSYTHRNKYQYGSARGRKFGCMLDPEESLILYAANSTPQKSDFADVKIKLYTPANPSPATCFKDLNKNCANVNNFSSNKKLPSLDTIPKGIIPELNISVYSANGAFQTPPDLSFLKEKEGLKHGDEIVTRKNGRPMSIKDQLIASGYVIDLGVPGMLLEIEDKPVDRPSRPDHSHLSFREQMEIMEKRAEERERMHATLRPNGRPLRTADMLKKMGYDIEEGEGPG